MKESVKLVLVLTVICAISSAMLAAVYSKTKEPIANALKLRTAKAATRVMPDGCSVPEEQQYEGINYFVAKQDGKPAGVALKGASENGYGGRIELMVGISMDQKLTGYETLIASETPGLGTKIDSDGFRNPLLQRSLDKEWKVKQDGGDVDAITAATISSRAAVECINDAAAQFKRIKSQL